MTIIVGSVKYVKEYLVKKSRVQGSGPAAGRGAWEGCAMIGAGYDFSALTAQTDGRIITQDIIEVAAAETGLVSAARIGEEITHQGRIAIYDIRFDADSARIRPESSEALALVAEFLRANPGRRYFIVGHAAGIGDFATGLTLSRDRAQAVLDELVERYSVPRTQLAAHGVGALSPAASNRSPEGAAMNRRVELVEQ